MTCDERDHAQRIAKTQDKPGPGFTLRRVSWLQRTVWYEWPCSHCGMDHHCAAFTATSQEWDRAHD